ncbi:MAG: S53 family peptidase, partial [Actinomycetota bacterium]
AAGTLLTGVVVAIPPHDATVRAVSPVPASAANRLAHHEFLTAPTAEQCRTVMAVTCYSPLQLRAAYAVTPLQARGIDGRGTTIAVVVSFGSPTIEHDLREFDRVWGLPDPPSISTITPAGPVPPFDASSEEMVGWAYETTLDVQYAHAMAPEAKILVVATPVSETQGVQGFPEMVRAENYVVDHQLADIISQSFGAIEQTFPSAQSIRDLRGAFRNAERNGVTVLAAGGDTGAAGYESDQSGLLSAPASSWPATDPLVTGVGGTRLELNAAGNRVRADRVWQDAYGAGGGGLSGVFDRPLFQYPVAAVVGDRRGTPDIAMSAGIDGGVLVYGSYDPDETGWSVVGGTSEATPLFAGLVALAAQAAGHRLGDLNPALYALGARGDGGIVDVTSGSNGWADVIGYRAARGYDLASGWGTIDASRFVPALAATASG